MGTPELISLEQTTKTNEMSPFPERHKGGLGVRESEGQRLPTPVSDPGPQPGPAS